MAISGWESVGYGLAGGYERDRKAIQEQARNYELFKRGIDPQTNKYIEGSKEDLLAIEVGMLKQNLQDMNSQYIKSQEYDAIADSVSTGDFSSWNDLINSNPIMNEIYKNQQGIHKIYAPTSDTWEEYSVELDKAGLDPISEYVKVQLANIDQQTGEPIKDIVIVDGLEISAENQDTINSTIKQIGVAYPLSENNRGEKSLMSLEEHLANTGLLKAKFMKSQSDGMIQAVVDAENALEGITTRLNEANTKQQEELARKQEYKSNVAESQSKLVVDILDDETLGDSEKISLYRALMNPNNSDSRTALQKNYAFLEDKYGKEKANELITATTSGKTVVREEKDTEKEMNYIESTPGAKDISDVDLTRLDKTQYTEFSKKAEEQAKDIKDEDKKLLASLTEAANGIDVDDLTRVTGIVDASVNSFLDSVGAGLPEEVTSNQANYAIIKNSILRSMIGSQQTVAELAKMDKQVSTEFKADSSVRQKLALNIRNLASQYDMYKDKRYYYAKHIRPKVVNLLRVADVLEGRTKANAPRVTPEQKSWLESQGAELRDDGKYYINGRPLTIRTQGAK